MKNSSTSTYIAATESARRIVAEMDARCAAETAPNLVAANERGRDRRIARNPWRCIAGRLAADRRTSSSDRRLTFATIGSFCWGG
jgi:hypothetical protein